MDKMAEYTIFVNDVKVEVEIAADETFTLHIERYISHFLYVECDWFLRNYKRNDYFFKFITGEGEENYYCEYDKNLNCMYTSVYGVRMNILFFQDVEQYEFFTDILYQIISRYK